LKLRQTLGVEQRQRKQAADSNRLHGERNQSCPAPAGTVSPGRVEQRVSKHGGLLSFCASRKDTGMQFRGWETIAVLKK
jgi:hypothetical protein